MAKFSALLLATVVATGSIQANAKDTSPTTPTPKALLKIS